MIGLNGSLSIAAEALEAQYAGLAVTNNNIANANTAGYSRQIVSLSASSVVQNGQSVDTGVSYDGYTSVRDSVLAMSINNKTSDQGSLSTQSSLLTGVNSAFSGTTSGVGASLSTLFSDISALSTNPTDSATRQTVLTAANQLASAFHQGAASLSAATTSANQQVTSTVSQINQLSSQIASLNGQLAGLSNGQDGGSLEDQRDALTTQLAALTGVNSTSTETTPTLTTANGSPLVVGSTAYPLQVSTGADGTTHVLDSSGNDITSQLSGGTLGGAITTRDTTLPALSQQLDTLASQFSSAMNAAQAKGYDSSGNQGQALFTVPSTGSAAAGITVALTDPNGLAASSSSSSSSGSSGNVANLLAVQTAALPSGSTPTDSYANLVYAVGAAGSQVSTSLTATTAALGQLTTQRDSESGVSIDEESTNLIRFQQGYQAAAKVISTISDCYSTILNMTSGT